MRTIHHKTDKFYIMPISGKHIVCSCGKWFQENYQKDKNRYTDNKDKVTCKNCIRKLNKEKIEMNLPKYIDLREQFKKEMGIEWKNEQGELDIEYVAWLENNFDVLYESYLNIKKMISNIRQSS